MEEKLSDKDLSKKLRRIMYKAEGRGKFFFLSPLASSLSLLLFSLFSFR